MARINLLPWREEVRRERQKKFMMSLLVTAIVSVIIIFLVGLFFDQKISHQQFRNNLLNAEITKMEQRIKRIDVLERTRENLLSRKRVIEQLQASRSMTVELLDNLARSIPVGVTLSSITQQGMALSLNGTSQSNARVSAYLKELEGSELFLNPQLGFVKAADKPGNAAETYEFSIRVNLRPIDTGQDEYGDDVLDDQGGAE